MLRYLRDRVAIATLTAFGAAFLLAALILALSCWIGPIGAFALVGAVFLLAAALIARLPPPKPEPVSTEGLGFVLGFVAIRALMRRFGR